MIFSGFSVYAGELLTFGPTLYIVIYIIYVYRRFLVLFMFY